MPDLECLLLLLYGFVWCVHVYVHVCMCVYLSICITAQTKILVGACITGAGSGTQPHTFAGITSSFGQDTFPITAGKSPAHPVLQYSLPTPSQQ